MWEYNPCGMMIRQLHLSLARLTDKALQKYNLTFSQIAALMAIDANQEKELSLKELEKALQVSQPNVAGIITRLEKKKMVCGFTDPMDKRVKRARLTSLGQQYCIEAKDNMIATEEHLLAGMSVEEREKFKKLLQQACKNMA